jgi:RNA polymerase sigma-70 factor, ECF subfamily
LRDVLGFRAREVAGILDRNEASVKGALQRARSTLRARLGVAPSEHAALPPSKREREVVGRFTIAVEAGDIEGVVALLADDAWLTMPPEPYEYQGPGMIGAFLRDRTARRGAPLLVATRANTQPAFGCYFPTPHTQIARAAAMFVLTLEGERISAITWFGDSSVFPHFGLPRILR